MPDVTGFVAMIKKAALEAVASSKPMNIYFGEVESSYPLRINVEQRMVLGEKQLILTRQVTDYSLSVDIDLITESADGHAHKLTGKKKLTVHNSLKKGESVIIARQQGGQKFIVIDRVGDSV